MVWCFVSFSQSFPIKSPSPGPMNRSPRTTTGLSGEYIYPGRGIGGEVAQPVLLPIESNSSTWRVSRWHILLSKKLSGWNGWTPCIDPGCKPPGWHAPFLGRAFVTGIGWGRPEDIHDFRWLFTMVHCATQVVSFFVSMILPPPFRLGKMSAKCWLVHILASGWAA